MIIAVTVTVHRSIWTQLILSNKYVIYHFIKTHDDFMSHTRTDTHYFDNQYQEKNKTLVTSY